MQQHFVFIGMSDDGAPDFGADARRAIASGRLFSGGRRHRAIVEPLLPEGAEWIDIAVPLDDVFRRYEGEPEVVVFASGDPLFFGFAATVRRRLPEARITLYPSFNSLQTLAHRLALPYDDLRIVSLTGRPWDGLDAALIEGAAKIGCLTDREHTPDAIARRLVDYGYTGYTLHVGERLGNRTEERIVTCTAGEAAGRTFGLPNCVILHGTPRHAPFGIPESEFELLDGRTKMITKMPVRLTALSMLDLAGRRTLWDVGFCTGSVSVEARLRFPQLRVEAFEIRPGCERLLDANARRFGAPGIRAHIGDFLSADLTAVAPPDAVFIGGHGGRLDEVTGRIARHLAPGGTVVFNSVSAESLEAFRLAAARHGLTLTGRVTLSVDTHNPITILQARKR